jgi:AraC family transcriptional regulator of adaptative response / DNA-3-methyladenine glycosylase II
VTPIETRPLDPASCYRALTARDARFDGVFYVAVSTTGIYCRPICPARTPGQARCTFFVRAAEAERAGFRACFRCRPELAPGYASVDATERLAQAAVELIDGGVLEDGGLERLAARLGVTSRHVRRIFERSFGVTPVEYAQTQRLLLAKRLLTDTSLPVTEVALASGFGSVRRFNALWKARYRMAPGLLRKQSAPDGTPASMRFELAYRPPYHWTALVEFLAARAIDGVEAITGATYRRTLAIDTAASGTSDGSACNPRRGDPRWSSRSRRRCRAWFRRCSRVRVMPSTSRAIRTTSQRRWDRSRRARPACACRAASMDSSW